MFAAATKYDGSIGRGGWDCEIEKLEEDGVNLIDGYSLACWPSMQMSDKLTVATIDQAVCLISADHGPV